LEKKDKIEKQANRKNKLKPLHTQKLKKIPQINQDLQKKHTGKLFLKIPLTLQILDFFIKNNYCFLYKKEK
jgi:hypothetical protein